MKNILARCRERVENHLKSNEHTKAELLCYLDSMK